MKNIQINFSQYSTLAIALTKKSGLIFTLLFALSVSTFAQIGLSDLGINAPKINLKVGNNFNAYAYQIPKSASGHIKIIEVLPFSSYESPVIVDLLRDEIAVEITHEKINKISDKVFFEALPEKVYEVSTSSNSLEVHKIVTSIIEHGSIDDAKKAKLETLTAAQAIVSGQLTANLSKPEKTKSDKPDKKGRYTYTTTHNLKMQVILHFTDLTTGRNASITVEESVSDTEHSYKNYPSVQELASKEELTKMAIETSVRNMVDFFTPYYFKENVQLEKPKNKKLKAQFKTALKAAQKGSLEEACGIFHDLYIKNPADAEASFNIAAMKYASGDYASAIQYYERAMELDPKKKKYQSWKEQAVERQQNAERLAEFELELQAIDYFNGAIVDDIAEAN